MDNTIATFWICVRLRINLTSLVVNVIPSGLNREHNGRGVAIHGKAERLVSYRSVSALPKQLRLSCLSWHVVPRPLIQYNAERRLIAPICRVEI